MTSFDEDDDTRWVCWQCVSDPYLRAWVDDSGEAHTCAFCQREFRSVTVAELAEKIDVAMRANYTIGADTPHVVDWSDNTQWWQEGEEFNDVVQEIAGIDLEVAEAVLEYLRENEDCYIADGDESFYGSDLIEAIPVTHSRFDDLWTEFEQRVKHQVRFFDSEGRALLDRIFGDVRSLANGEAIATLPAGTDLRMYRARLIDNQPDAERFLRHPEIELGPPPAARARAGRLNPAGVPAFYGAFSESVALAEIRPVVGSIVAVGSFTVMRELHLLDFTFFPFAYHSESIFSPHHQETRERVKFFQQFQAQMSRPVSPSDELLGYIPTQAVAAYFTNVVGLDGFIYASTQTWAEGHAVARVSREGCNFALFGKAARVAAAGSDAMNSEAALRAEPTPKLHRIRSVTVGSTSIWGHVYEDGSVIISEDDDGSVILSGNLGDGGDF